MEEMKKEICKFIDNKYGKLGQVFPDYQQNIMTDTIISCIENVIEINLSLLEKFNKGE
jgi:hypothetical protein